MKNWILAALFMVQWNEYELKPHYDRDPNEGTYIDTTTGLGFSDAFYRAPVKILFETVEIATHTIKLATQKDVDLFVPRSWWKGEYQRTAEDALLGLIPTHAFNIKVTEVEK